MVNVCVSCEAPPVNVAYSTDVKVFNFLLKGTTWDIHYFLWESVVCSADGNFQHATDMCNDILRQKTQRLHNKFKATREAK